MDRGGEEEDGSCHSSRSCESSVRGGTWGTKAEASYAAEAALRAALVDAHEKAARKHQLARRGLEAQGRRRAEEAHGGERHPLAGLLTGLGRKMRRALRSAGQCLGQTSQEQQLLG